MVVSKWSYASFIVVSFCFVCRFRVFPAAPTTFARSVPRYLMSGISPNSEGFSDIDERDQLAKTRDSRDFANGVTASQELKIHNRELKGPTLRSLPGIADLPESAEMKTSRTLKYLERP